MRPPDAPDGMADGDGAAIHIHLGPCPSRVPCDGASLSAKASLDSTRSRSAAFQPLFFKAMRDAGSDRAMILDPRRTSPKKRCAPAASVRAYRSLALISTNAAAP